MVNNKKISNDKLNLPTAWTKKKMMSLFLMGWLSVNGVEAGKAFENCLSFEYNNAISYDAMLDFSPNIKNKTSFCCDKFRCWLDGGDSCGDGSHFSSRELSLGTMFIQRGRKKIGRDDWEEICSGILGNTPIIGNFTIADPSCPSDKLDFLISYAKNKNFSEIRGANSGYAELNCSKPLCSEKLDLIFSWDNGGWICNGWGEACLFQWKADWPGPADKSPSTSTVVAHPNDPYLTEKIAIPIGTVVGVATVGGITYLIYKREKNNPRLPRMEHAIEFFPPNELEEPKEEVINELEQLTQTEQEQLQTKIEQPPK